jgi:orotate phosphoribosyltransferase
MTPKVHLHRIDPSLYRDKDLHIEEILGIFDQEDAFWVYPGEPRPEVPHAKLTTGACSNGFIDCMRVLRYPKIAEILGRQLGRMLRRMGIDNVDYVIGSPYAAITFAHEVAKELDAIAGFCTKDHSDPKGKKMLWGRLQMPKGSKVLQVEELVTTSFTFREIHRAIEAGNVHPVKFYEEVGTLVHRPEKLPMEYDGRIVWAMVEKAIQKFEPGPNTCPYCAVGSEPLRPKGINWLKLKGKI